MDLVLASSSQLIRKRVNDDDDEEVSEKETQLITRKRPKKTTTLVSSSPVPWTKKDEILILKGIVEYERETELSYRSDWDAFYARVQGLTEANFGKVELRRHVRKLKKRFTEFEDGKVLSFADTDDDEIFSLSMKIWGKRGGSDVNLEHAKVVNERMDQAKADVSCGEQELNDGEKEKKTEQVSNTETRVSGGKIMKSTLSTPSSRMDWTRTDELIILTGVVAFELEKELSYQDDWDGLYSFIKGSTELEFTEQQLKDNIWGLKKRFNDNMAKYEDEKGVSFISTEDDKIAKLSLVIWGEKAMDSTNLEHDEQINEFVEQPTDLTHVEHETNNENIVETKVDESEKEKKKKKKTKRKVDNGGEEKKKKKKVNNGEEEKKKVDETKDASFAEQKQADESKDEAKADVPNAENGQVKESDKVGEDAICDLQETLEAVPGLGKTHQKFLVQNLKNLDAEDGEELIKEWKDLVEEEFHLHMKKLTYSTKLANKIASA